MEKVTAEDAHPSLSGFHTNEHTYTYILHTPTCTHMHTYPYELFAHSFIFEERHMHTLLCGVQKNLCLRGGFRVGHPGETQTLALFILPVC